MRIIPYLLVSLALSCKNPIPDSPSPEDNDKQHYSEKSQAPPEVESEQHYSGRIDGLFAIYTQRKEDCSLLLSSEFPIGTLETRIIDKGCDNSMDSVFSLQEGRTLHLRYENIDFHGVMKKARETSYEGYLKFKAACVLTVKNKGSGYCVDLDCDDSVDYLVNEMPRSALDTPLASDFDTLLRRGKALAKPENHYTLELEQLLDLFSIESLRTME